MSFDENKKNMCQNSIKDFFIQISKFQYEKARNCLDKYKDLNNKIMLQFQTVFIYLINGEKYYNNLVFMTKLTDKYYEPASSLLDQIAKENSYGRIHAASNTSYDTISIKSQAQSSHVQDQIPIDEILEFIDQLIQFIELRHQMMKFYLDLRENRQNKSNIDQSQNQLIDIENKYNGMFTHPLIEELKKLYSLEIVLMKYLLQCHVAIDFKFDCVRSLVCIKSVNSLFLSRLPSLNNKLSKETKGFSFFSRSSSQQRSMPVLYQWYKIYYQCLLNKFSIIMHDSLPNDVGHIMIEKNDTYNKLVSFIKKTPASLMGILLDASRLDTISFRGIGYELIPSASSLFALPGTDSYHLVFLCPKQNNGIDEHIKNLSSQINTDHDQRVKYYFDPNLKSTYYLSKISEYYTFFMILEQNKQENKGKTMSFIQEISDDLNLTKILEILNGNLK